MVMKVTALVGAVASVALAGSASAQQLVYTPLNPSFGGSPFNTQFQSLAGIQNQFQKQDTSAAPTQAELFAQQLQSSLLAGVAQQVSNAIFGDNPAQQGTISFGGTSVNFLRNLDNVTVNITDPKGVTTQIVVPTFVKSN